MAMGPVDIIQRRLLGPSARLGVAPPSRVAEVVMTMQASIRSTSKVVARVSGGASRRIDKECRLGPSRIGSYIVTLYCPVDGGDKSNPGSDLARDTTEAIGEQLRYLLGRRDPAQGALPLSLQSLECVNAASRLIEATDGEDSSMRISFDGHHRVDLLANQRRTDAVTREYQLAPRMVARLGQVRDRLERTKNEKREATRFIGRVVTLSVENPEPGNIEVHEIAMRGNIGGRPRRVRLGVTAGVFRQAFEWQTKRIDVEVRAVLTHRGHDWFSERLDSISPAQPASRH